MKKIFLIIPLILLSCKEKFGDKIYNEKFILIQKQYVPNTESIDVGNSTSGNIIITHTGSEEKFICILKKGNKIVSFESKKMYLDLKENDTVYLNFNKSLESDKIKIIY